MATETKAVLEARVHAFEEVLDLIQRDESDEDAPVNYLANDIEVLRHKAIAEIADIDPQDPDELLVLAEPRSKTLPETVENGAFETAYDEVYGQFCDIDAAVGDAAHLAGDNPDPNMKLHLARVRGYLAEAELAWGQYVTAVKDQ
jgi:hypothetical protein